MAATPAAAIDRRGIVSLALSAALYTASIQGWISAELSVAGTALGMVACVMLLPTILRPAAFAASRLPARAANRIGSCLPAAWSQLRSQHADGGSRVCCNSRELAWETPWSMLWTTSCSHGSNERFPPIFCCAQDLTA